MHFTFAHLVRLQTETTVTRPIGAHRVASMVSGAFCAAEGAGFKLVDDMPVGGGGRKGATAGSAGSACPACPSL
jgi:hypothetical protein